MFIKKYIVSSVAAIHVWQIICESKTVNKFCCGFGEVVTFSLQTQSVFGNSICKDWKRCVSSTTALVISYYIGYPFINAQLPAANRV